MGEIRLKQLLRWFKDENPAAGGPPEGDQAASSRLAGVKMDMVDKNKWISDVVPGRTFADVGGLWGTVNEMVTVAGLAGASHSTMIDIQPLGNEWWRAFEERAASLNVSNYSCIHADATLDGFSEQVGRYDVVHCSGIIYHLPDPFQLILRLREITREHMLLTSMYIPEFISNAEGELDLTGGEAILAHAITNPARRAVIVRHFEDRGLQIAGLTAPLNEPLVLPNGRGNTSPWWWLMTPGLLKSMLEIGKFEVLEMGDSWEDRSVSFLCRAV